MFETPFDAPLSMEDALFMTVLYEEGVARCQQCGSTELKKLKENKLKCRDCGTVMKAALSMSEIARLVQSLDEGNKDTKIAASTLLYNLPKKNHEEVLKHLDDLEQHLTSNIPGVRINITGLMTELARDHQERTAHLTETMLELIDDDRLEVRKNAASFLALATRNNEELILNNLKKITARLKKEDLKDRAPFMKILALLAETNPKDIADHRELILEHIKNSEGETLIGSLNTLAQLTKHRAGITPIDLIRPLLTHEDPEIRQDSTAIISFIAEQAPNKIDDDIKKTLKRLKHDGHEVIEQNAEEALDDL